MKMMVIIFSVSALLGLAFMQFTKADPVSSVIIVDRPLAMGFNPYYLNNRAPLIHSAFLKLPVAVVQPEGWLKECLIRQKNGLTGKLGQISAWLTKTNNAWLSKDGKGDYGWEEVPYWLKGFANLGYILHDTSIQAESKLWLEGVLNSQRADGNFGPTLVDNNGAEDFWPKMIMLYCLQSYYEYTGNKKIIDFMTKYFRYQLHYPENMFIRQFHYWQGLRTGDNLHSVLWLYNITGDTLLLKLAHKIHRNSTSWENRNNPVKKEMDQGQEMPEWYKLLPDWHNVNIAQGFREPATYYQLSKDSNDLRATYEVFNIVRKYFGQVPGGLFGGDEIARPGYSDPRQAMETCGIVEEMNSAEHLLRITGDPFWADHTENVVFNSFPAALMPDFKSLRYLTSPNMILSDAENHNPGLNNTGPFLMMNPFSSRCCQHNHTQGWPYYTENLWMATADKGAVAVLYAASKVAVKVGDGTTVMFKEITNYPFEDKVLFKVLPSKPVHFPFYLRVPAWCNQAVITVNGEELQVRPDAGKYVRIDRLWKKGDKVILKLPMQVQVTNWKENKNSVSVNYGPLSFSLKIEERYIRKESDKTAIFDSRWQKGVDVNAWPSYEIHPSSPWNYGLVLNELDTAASFTVINKKWPEDNFPFTPNSTPVLLKVKACQIPAWKLDQYKLCGVLSPAPVKSDAQVNEVELIPMGAARLRISAFPCIDNGPRGKEWISR